MESGHRRKSKPKKLTKKEIAFFMCTPKVSRLTVGERDLIFHALWFETATSKDKVGIIFPTRSSYTVCNKSMIDCRC